MTGTVLAIKKLQSQANPRGAVVLEAEADSMGVTLGPKERCSESRF